MQFQFVAPFTSTTSPTTKTKSTWILQRIAGGLKVNGCRIKHGLSWWTTNTGFRFEEVKLIDNVAAVRECIKVLAAQKELQCLGKKLKTEFKDVFSEIPHIDELPMDVYCHIKLKDTLKTV
jgi:hypothetical protein